MILLFPDLDTFRLALTGALVPPEVLATAATVSFEADGRISIETDPRLPKKSVSDLARIGVTQTKRHLGPTETVTCWPQVIPVARDPNPPQLAAQTPVLFELEDAEDLPVIVGEMLRLGNDRQTVRWLNDNEDGPRVLLRVVGPPYYTLLRAIEQTASGTKGAIRAYVEQVPRVWVQLGYRHELATQVTIDDERVLLIRPLREWIYLSNTPFQDVYEILQFHLPASPVEWSEKPFTEKLTVPLKLAAGNAADVPELWVLRGEATNQLDIFVRDSDERLIQRLKFAVATSPQGESVIVLRVTASKLAPPILTLADAVSFKPYFKLPNLYLPIGTRLHPTLRRDAIRKLLAEDTDQLVWLFPGPDGTFTPEQIPEDSFRPLEDWVDYVIETNHAPLSAWVEASRFEFEHFICTDSGKPPSDPGSGSKSRRRSKGTDAPLTPDTPQKGSSTKPAAPADPTAVQAVAAALETRKPGEWEVRCRQLQTEFLAFDGPLDIPERQALWPELAIAHSGANDYSEAALSWINAIWGQSTGSRDWAEQWLRSELRDQNYSATAGEIDKYLKIADPKEIQVRQFTALVFWLTHQDPIPSWFTTRLSTIKRYVEANERKLPIRVVWLVATRLTTLTGTDTLGLARVRDRILQRLLEEGINADRDLPFFLRSAGLHDSERLRHVRAMAIELHQTVRSWLEASLKPVSISSQSDQGASLAYTDLFFAFALAKMGETTTGRQLIESARQVLESYKPTEERGIAGRFLFQALKYRIEQQLAGKPHTGLLDAKLLEELEVIRLKGKGQVNKPYGLAYYAITRFQQQSRILEPQEELNPFDYWMMSADELKKTLAELQRIKDPNALAKAIRELYRSGLSGKPIAEVRFLVLHEALSLSARVGEQFTFELLALVPEAMKASSGAGLTSSELSEKQGQLLARAIFLAAHFDRKDTVQHLVDQFVLLLRTKPEEQQFELINVVASQCLKSLRRLNLRDEINKFLNRMQEIVIGGQNLDKVRNRPRGTKGTSRADMWGKVLQSLLHLAGAWLTFGLNQQAGSLLDDARNELIGPNPTPFPAKEFTSLAQAYVAALGHGPADTGLPKIAELFNKMAPNRITNTLTSSSVYSRLHMNLVEETVTALLSDDFALGPAGRRWLDEDEYLIRKRIHADMKHHLALSEL